MFIHDIARVIHPEGERRLSSIRFGEKGYPALSHRGPTGSWRETRIVEERASSHFKKIFLNTFCVNGDRLWLLRIRSSQPLKLDHGYLYTARGKFEMVSLQALAHEPIKDFDGYMVRLEGNVLVGVGMQKPVYVQVPFGQEET